MDDLVNICLPCGFCCNGTLIGFVQIDREEIPAVEQLIDIEKTNDTGVIIQPCPRFCDKCTIYSERPRRCGDFECVLLKSVEKGTLDFDIAVDMLRDFKTQKEGIEEQLPQLDFELQSQSFYFRMIELQNTLDKKKADIGLSQLESDLIADLTEYDHLMFKLFGISLD